MLIMMAGLVSQVLVRNATVALIPQGWEKLFVLEPSLQVYFHTKA